MFTHCQGMESWNHLGQKRPLISSDDVFYWLTDEWVLQTPQIHTWPTLHQPQMPQTDTCTNTPDTRNMDVCENPNFIYGITRGMCLENRRVSPRAFWLWYLELQKERYNTLPQTLGLFFPWNRAWYHWLIPVKSACRTPSPRDSKPLSCYLVAKGIVSRTPTSLCTKYRGILIHYLNLRPSWLHKREGQKISSAKLSAR